MTEHGKKQDNGAGKIVVKGARTHNLKNITVEMPRNKIVAITGLSGSGKSSLAFDTIFAEGQRRYVESLSAYARQFLRQMQKPDVDEISGLSPAISIDQKSASGNPRSTVATITEIYDYLRVLFARVGKAHCLICDRIIRKLSNEEIIELVFGKIQKLDVGKSAKRVLDVPYSDAKVRIYAPVVLGRKGEYYQLLYDLLGKGYTHARVDGALKNLRERIELEKNKRHTIDVVVDEVFLTEFKEQSSESRERLAEAVERAINESDGLVRIEIPGVGEDLISARFVCPHDGFSYPEIEPRLFSFNSPYGACEACNGLGTKHFFGTEPCPDCEGARLRKEALRVRLGGTGDTLGVNIVGVTALSIEEAAKFFKNLKLTPTERQIAKVILREIEDRLKFMLDVGIEYLTLDRRANTLSGGEAQRIRLASQLGSKLVGALYVLDEPTIGLHPRDNDKLLVTLKELRDLGNTVIVVEHDEDTIYSADYLVDVGPGAGIHGGEIVVAGDMDTVLADKKKYHSVTLDYLRGDKEIPMPEKRRTTPKGALQVRGASIFNLQNVDVEIPLGKFVAVTGVSGSGKSSLVYEVIHKNLEARFDRRYRSNDVYNCASFSGTEYVSRVVLIDQSPIGRTPRSNPATYTGAFSYIRDLFTETAEARARGWKAGRFSFNVKGGRCEACQGNGVIAVEMHFLPTVYVTCDVCRGKRFQKETLEVKYKKKNIYEVLHLTVEEAVEFFEDIPAIYDRLQTMVHVGLGYLELGQPSTTLSGGESQRIKIASELYRPFLTKAVYILDEPTVGLHYEDVAKLIEILNRLVDQGNTVLVIEHNMDVVKNADYVVDIGPEGGNGGGKIVAKGTPEQIAQSKKSHTGKYLAKVLG
ncbi:MAG: excinuclease ABC subunit A [Candidatus Lloydbacteria bacterium RIFCSPLOWO2_02_FULL_51_11]|uniref:UvrABC system protein A n=1 Tax=Candidatus Lloydbacteria bacterium RIFCSPLOWO2_02_FULL_51_11 TaxID=1798667 RepID=A0A1G2DQE1_9BACT|nr:MAG: excinuclease ABC subunit A [Candidatus Lloydbacteria bacterium RIFCSPLOWO2_02_FULL_51_11]